MRRNARNRNNIKKRKKSSNSNKIIISLLSIIILLLLCIIFFFAFNKFTINSDLTNISQEQYNNLISNTSESKSTVKEDITFTLTSIGDIMCHNTQYWDAYNSDTDTYDFSYVFEDIKQYTENADLCIGNIETTFAGKERGYSNYPTFNSPDELAYALKDIGIDIITTAGNHALDTGYSGLCRTIDVLDNAQIKHLGTYKSKEEQQKVFIQDVKGVKIAFIDYTYGTNGIPLPEGKEYCVNLIDHDSIKADLQSAKDANADMIIACMHWGTEYRLTPDDSQKELATFLFKNGVNIILGNHPHVLEPMSKTTILTKDGSTKDGFVIYAHGNFICDQHAENTRNSIILNLTVTKHRGGTITVDKADYVPIYMYKNPNKSIRKMKLLDIEKSIKNYADGTDTSIGSNTYLDLKVQLDKIKNIVGSIE